MFWNVHCASATPSSLYRMLPTTIFHQSIIVHPYLRPLNSCLDFSSKWQNSNTIFLSWSSLFSMLTMPSIYFKMKVPVTIYIRYLQKIVKTTHANSVPLKAFFIHSVCSCTHLTRFRCILLQKVIDSVLENTHE